MKRKKSTNLFSGPEVKAVTRPSFGSMVLLALNKKNLDLKIHIYRYIMIIYKYSMFKIAMVKKA